MTNIVVFVDLEGEGEDEAPSTPYLVDRAWYDERGHEARMWLVATDCWEWGKPSLDWHCDTPIGGFLEYAVEGVGLHEALLPNGEYGDATKFLLENGIAPGQPFYVLAEWDYHRGDGWETDDDWKIEVTILDVEPWPAERVMNAWEALLFRRQGGGPLFGVEWPP